MSRVECIACVDMFPMAAIHPRVDGVPGAMRVAKTIELDEHTERELRVLAKRRRVEARLQQRALVVLLAAKGWQNKGI